MLVGFESVDDFLELLDHPRAHDVERRVIERDAPTGGRAARDADLCGVGQCACSCHVLLLPLPSSLKTVDWTTLFRSFDYLFVARSRLITDAPSSLTMSSSGN